MTDGDSMTINNLRDSANGTFVTMDDYLTLTICRLSRPVVTVKKRPVRVPRKIDTRLSLDCKNTNLFVERLEKDKDTYKDVDADRDRTGRAVVSGQTTRSCTQLEEVDIDSGVSGLAHAVVKQAENSRVRELVKKIESHRHRQDLQADLQQGNAYNPVQ